MSNMNSRMKADLDNYITGHYGEDQIDDYHICPDCGEELEYDEDTGTEFCDNEDCPSIQEDKEEDDDE